MLGLLCCSRAFSSYCERGLLFFAVHRLLISMASPVEEHRLQVHGLQQLQQAGSVVVAFKLSCSAEQGISQIRGQTYVPCIGRWILIHCTTKGVPTLLLDGSYQEFPGGPVVRTQCFHYSAKEGGGKKEYRWSVS